MQNQTAVTEILSMSDIFGEPIHTYSRQQALDDGVLVDVTDMAKATGFRFPVAMTSAAWADAVKWTDKDSERQTYQDESGRLKDALWMGYCAARRNSGKSAVDFQFYRVPRGGRGHMARLTTLRIVCGMGDDGEPVMTIMMPYED